MGLKVTERFYSGVITKESINQIKVGSNNQEEGSQDINTEYRLQEGLSYLMFVDQSSVSTACAFFTEEGKFRGFILFQRYDIDPVEYKVKMKKYFEGFFSENNIKKIFYEEVFNNYVNEAAYQTMILIRDTFREFKYEYDIPTEEIPNTFWKKRLLFPDKLSTKENHKVQVKNKLIELGYDFLDGYKQDVFDAVGMGVSRFRALHGELPKSLTEKPWKPSKRFGVTLNNVYVDDEDDIIDYTSLVDDKDILGFIQDRGAVLQGINKKYDVETNIRYRLEEMEEKKDCRCLILQVPDYRYFGSYLVVNNIPYEENRFLYVFAKKKSW